MQQMLRKRKHNPRLQRGVVFTRTLIAEEVQERKKDQEHHAKDSDSNQHTHEVGIASGGTLVPPGGLARGGGRILLLHSGGERFRRIKAMPTLAATHWMPAMHAVKDIHRSFLP